MRDFLLFILMSWLPSPLIGIDLFCGAGGMSLGAKLAGIELAAAVDMDRNAAKTYRVNHPTVQMLEQDVCEIQELSKPHNRGPVVLFGGPPCQGFSTSNQKTRNVCNARNWLFEEFFRIARTVDPEWIVFENVRGLSDTSQGKFLKHIFARLIEMRYIFAYGLLNAADFGVPQERHRLFIVATRLGFMPLMPRPLIGNKYTLRDAIWDLPSLANGAAFAELPYRRVVPSAYARQMRGALKVSTGHAVSRNAKHIIERYHYIRPGGNWEDIPPRLLGSYEDASRCHTGIYRRLKWDAPAVVIGNFRKNMLIHPREDRTLSVREAARIQSFPDNYQFHGSIGFQQQQVGNAVPPLLAKAVFRAVIQQTMEWKAAGGGLKK